jgi:hypothetical protein
MMIVICGVEVLLYNFTVMMYYGLEVSRINYDDCVLWSGGTVIVLQ